MECAWCRKPIEDSWIEKFDKYFCNPEHLAFWLDWKIKGLKEQIPLIGKTEGS